MPHRGFRRGSYQCNCAKGHYFPPVERSKNHAGFYNGTDVERSYVNRLRNLSSDYEERYRCLPCLPGCPECTSAEPCFVQYDALLRGVPLGVETFCMTITLVLGLVIMKIRRSKVCSQARVFRIYLFIYLKKIKIKNVVTLPTHPQ